MSEFRCTICSKPFESHRSMVGHLANHSIKRFINASHCCRFCNENFSQIRFLRQHLRKAHNYPDLSLNTRVKRTQAEKDRDDALRRCRAFATGREFIPRRPQGGPRKGSGFSPKGMKRGIYCESTWEAAVVEYFYLHNKPISRNEVGFEYTFEGKQHKYYPDFIIGPDCYLEVKGVEKPVDKAKWSSLRLAHHKTLKVCGDIQMRDVIIPFLASKSTKGVIKRAVTREIFDVDITSATVEEKLKIKDQRRQERLLLKPHKPHKPHKPRKTLSPKSVHEAAIRMARSSCNEDSLLFRQRDSVVTSVVSDIRTLLTYRFDKRNVCKQASELLNGRHYNVFNKLSVKYFGMSLASLAKVDPANRSILESQVPKLEAFKTFAAKLANI